MVNRKHDLVAVVVNDDMEKEIPPMGLVDFQDAESGEVMTVDTSSIVFQRSYKKAVARAHEKARSTSSKVPSGAHRCDL